MKIKICGMKYPKNISEVAKLQPDFMGFIFYEKSPRFVGTNISLSVMQEIDPQIKKVGVFVNEKIKNLLEIQDYYQFDYIQLHGNETAEYCEFLKTKNLNIIKAFGINENFNFSNLRKYQESCDYFLFDTKSAQYGGTGTHFDWKVLYNYKLYTPFFLSGGIGLSNIEEATKFKHKMLAGIDLNSKLETSAGVKSVQISEATISKIYIDENI